jgi:hypothetical protein
MKIKIISINQVLPVYNGISKTNNKPYAVYAWLCNVLNNNVQEQNMTVKTMSQQTANTFKAGEDYEVKRNVYNNVKSYVLENESKSGGFSKWSKPVYSQKEYDLLFQHAVKKIIGMSMLAAIKDENIKYDIASRLISTYMIGAQGAGVKIEIQQTKKPDVDPTMQVQPPVEENPFFGDKDIPF